MRNISIFLLSLFFCMCSINVSADQFTVYPTTAAHGTGATDYSTKTAGEVLVHGGTTSGAVRKNNGYMKFDLSPLPDTLAPITVQFHFFVNETNYPYWSITPVTLDPVLSSSTPELLWGDIDAEKGAGYYNYQEESSGYAPGWKMLDLGGTAVGDLTAALSIDWFALGTASVDTLSSYFLEIDGNTNANIPYLVVSDDPIYDPPYALTCEESGNDAELVWTNGATYDAIEIYDFDTLIHTGLGTDTAHTVVDETFGGHCYTVCGIIDEIPVCGTECCRVKGDCRDVEVDLGTLICGSTLVATGNSTYSGDYCQLVGNDAFYRFSVTETAFYCISLCGSPVEWNSFLYLYGDSCCGSSIIEYGHGCNGASDHQEITATLDPGTYYVLIDSWYWYGHGPYELAIHCLTEPHHFNCDAEYGYVELDWDNAGTYDSINIYEDDILIYTDPTGTEDDHSVYGVDPGHHCYRVCGVIDSVEHCSAECCLDFLGHSPRDLTCIENGDDVDLTWTNRDIYDSIEVNDGSTLITTLGGTETTYTVVDAAPGRHCYTVCGIIDGLSELCSEDCCLTLGSCADLLIDLGTIDCPGSLTVSGDTTGAVDYCGDYSGDDHYRFEVLAWGGYQISLCSTMADATLYIYDDSCCGSSLIGVSNNSCSPEVVWESIFDLDVGTYYISLGGDGTEEGPYDLAIDCLYNLATQPSGLTCTEIGAEIELSWINEDTYETISIFENGLLIDTLVGTATEYTVTDPNPGYTCYKVYGTIGTSIVPRPGTMHDDGCCLIVGYNEIEVVADFESDNGNFWSDDVDGWQWGAPTSGSCATEADGNVWATVLDGNYDDGACYISESPGIHLGAEGGFIGFDHCYDLEENYDGGAVWFTTDDFWYYHWDKIGGHDKDDWVHYPGYSCPWVYFYPSETEDPWYERDFHLFTGTSDGWVTDYWDFTEDVHNGMWLGESVTIRFVMGSDYSNTGNGWMIDNVVVLHRLDVAPIACDYIITPLVGTVPFSITHRFTLTNLLSGTLHWTRRISGKVNVISGNGNSYSNWRGGYTNVNPGDTYTSAFTVTVPGALPAIGSNTFTMITMDVTDAPYNQPPYPPSGTTCTKVNVVVAYAP